MTARLVHSVMAAGLENPELIARWRHDPRLLAGRHAELTGLDLDGLRKFAGLAAKIRHNGVREKLPLSFRLMSVARLEIEVFAAYAEERSRNGLRYAASVEDKTRDLVAFLGTWLDRGDPHHCLLWDLARHEQTLDALGQAAPDAARHRDQDRDAQGCEAGRGDNAADSRGNRAARDDLRAERRRRLPV